MREIKFRAWDEKAGKMVTPFYSIEHTGAWSVHNWESLAGPINPTYRVNIDIMQDTGLQDKNGKDVYEGDLLEVTYYDYAEGRGKVKTGHAILEVAYDEMMAGFAPFVDG